MNKKKVIHYAETWHVTGEEHQAPRIQVSCGLNVAHGRHRMTMYREEANCLNCCRGVLFEPRARPV